MPSDGGLLGRGKHVRTSLPGEGEEEKAVPLKWRPHPIWGNRDDPHFDFAFYSGVTNFPPREAY